MRTEEIKIYQFAELSEEAKQKAIQWGHDLNIYENWHDDIINDFKDNEDFFNITNVQYSGFWSQGDGAMFEYTGINNNFINSIIDSLKLPNWKKKVLKHCLYVVANGKHLGHYSHHKSINHNIYIELDNGAERYDNIERLINLYSDEITIAIIEKYEDLAKDLYSDLEQSYNYLTSKEAIIEAIELNEYEFTEDGKIY